MADREKFREREVGYRDEGWDGGHAVETVPPSGILPHKGVDIHTAANA